MNNTTNSDATLKKASLLERIKIALKLDDIGRVDKFLTRERRKLEREIKSLKVNISTLQYERTITIDTNVENLEDAQQVVKDKYEAVDVESITSNSDMENFSHVYWINIEEAETSLANLSVLIQEAEIVFKTNIDNLKKEIEIRENRIKAIS